MHFFKKYHITETHNTGNFFSKNVFAFFQTILSRFRFSKGVRFELSVDDEVLTWRFRDLGLPPLPLLPRLRVKTADN